MGDIIAVSFSIWVLITAFSAASKFNFYIYCLGILLFSGSLFDLLINPKSPFVFKENINIHQKYGVQLWTSLNKALASFLGTRFVYYFWFCYFFILDIISIFGWLGWLG